MVGLITQYRPDAVAMEQLFFTTNRTTAIAVAEARGVLLLAAEQQGVPVFNYTPLQVKSAVVGYGKAEKGAGDGNDPPPVKSQIRAQAR